MPRKSPYVIPWGKIFVCVCVNDMEFPWLEEAPDNRLHSPAVISDKVTLYRQYMSRLVGKPTMWFPNRFHTNRPVQAQKRARRLKFRIQVEEELYYPSGENKGADLLRGYREADLRLCFRLCRLLVFP